MDYGDAPDRAKRQAASAVAAFERVPVHPAVDRRDVPDDCAILFSGPDVPALGLHEAGRIIS